MRRLHKASMDRQKEIRAHDKETKRLDEETKRMQHAHFEQNWRNFVEKEAGKYDPNSHKFLGGLKTTVDHRLAVAKRQAENRAAEKAAAAKREAEKDAQEKADREKFAREYWTKKDAEAIAEAQKKVDAAKPAAAAQFDSDFFDFEDVMY